MSDKTKTPEPTAEPVPTTNPDAGRPATPGVIPGAASAPPPVVSHLKGVDLVPDISLESAQAGVLRQYRYWVGVTPSCPVESIDIAGVNFPKLNEKIVPDPMRGGGKKRIPVVGALVWLTEAKVQRMRERLPRTVVRFLDKEGRREEKGTGENIGDNAERPQRGHLITIPTAADLKDRALKGKPARAYAPDTQRDVPAARFMFAQLCPDQVNSERGETYPEPLEVTGLDWPGTIAGLDALLS